MIATCWALMVLVLLVSTAGSAAEHRPGGLTVEATYTFSGVPKLGEFERFDDAVGLPDDPQCTHRKLRITNSGLYFLDSAAENGCGLANFEPAWPAHATRAVVVFNASRAMDSDDPRTEPPPPGFLQTVELYKGGLAEGGPMERLHQHHIYEPTTGDAPSTRHTVEMDVDGVSSPHFVFRFFDRGMALGDFYTTSGVGWRGEAYRIAVHAPEVPLELDPASETVAVEGTDRVTHRAMSWTLDPRHHAPGNTSIVLRVHVPQPLEWAWLQAPGGARLVPSEVVEGSDGTTVVFASSSFDESGPGTYLFHTTSRVTVAVAPQVLPLSLLLIAAPLILATDVYRAAVLRGASEGRRFGRVEAAAVGMGGLWSVVLVWTVLSGRFPLVSSWPLGPFGYGFYGALFGVTLLAGAGWLLHRRRHLAAMRSEANEATARSEELEHFLASVTHDLKSPLIALDWLARDLQEELAHQAADPTIMDSLERLRRNVGGMDILVKDLLELQQAGRENVTDEAVALRSVVEEVRDSLHGQAMARGATVSVDPIEVETLRVPPTRLRQVLANLIGNAIKYGRDRDGHVYVTAVRSPDGGCRIEVRDDGPGVPPEERESVFEIFQRGGRARSGATEGTGIGLAIVQRIIDGWGGTITLDTGPEGGARFTVTLPPARVG